MPMTMIEAPQLYVATPAQKSIVASGYILVNIADEIAAHYTFATNRAACWRAATNGAFTKKQLLAQGWRCIAFWGEGEVKL